MLSRNACSRVAVVMCTLRKDAFSVPQRPGRYTDGDPLLSEVAMRLLPWLAVLVVGLLPGPVSAAPVDFRREVAPILAENCFQCHGPDDGARKGKLRLDQRDAALRGGRSEEPAIVPNKPG